MGVVQGWGPGAGTGVWGGQDAHGEPQIPLFLPCCQASSQVGVGHEEAEGALGEGARKVQERSLLCSGHACAEGEEVRGGCSEGGGAPKGRGHCNHKAV